MRELNERDMTDFIIKPLFFFFFFFLSLSREGSILMKTFLFYNTMYTENLPDFRVD